MIWFKPRLPLLLVAGLLSGLGFTAPAHAASGTSYYLTAGKCKSWNRYINDGQTIYLYMVRQAGSGCYMSYDAYIYNYGTKKLSHYSDQTTGGSYVRLFPGGVCSLRTGNQVQVVEWHLDDSSGHEANANDFGPGATC